jgi:hypothetical protein
MADFEKNYIEVIWNNNPIKMRRASQVKHLLSEEELKLCRQGKAVVIDREGNETGLDGSLSNGMVLNLKILA